VRIRGEEGYRTVVLLDGIRIDDPAGTQIATNFANLLVSDVAQIEVVRGPQSLLYGPDAVGGVIQILTDRPRKGFHYAAEASGSSYRTFAESGSLAYGADKVGVALSAAHQQTVGFTEKVGDPTLADDDGQRVLALHGVAHAEPNDDFGVDAVLHYTKSHDKFDGASAFAPFSPADPNRVLNSEEIDGRFAIDHHGWEGIKTELAYSVASSRRNDLDNGLPFAFGSRFDGDRQQATLISTVDIAGGQTLVGGADYMHVTAKTDAIVERSGDTGVYGEWQSAFAHQIYLTGGVRYDDDDKFGSHVSGRATAAWLPHLFTDETTKFHASYGTGFRAPSPFERATNAAAALRELREEDSRGVDAGVEQRFAARAAKIDVTLFEQWIRNEIRFDNVGFTGYFQEPGKSFARGVEITGTWHKAVRFGPMTAFDLQTALTYTDSKVHSPDAENGLPRIRRPRYMTATTLSLDFAEDRGDLTITLRSAAKTEDGFSSFRVPLDAYGAVDVSARWKLTPRVEAFVRGDNVLNEQYEEVSGFATSDAAIYAGLRIRGGT
jgi:vitamin B12 transporter